MTNVWSDNLYEEFLAELVDTVKECGSRKAGKYEICINWSTDIRTHFLVSRLVAAKTTTAVAVDDRSTVLDLS
jgi:hypothetical protein